MAMDTAPAQPVVQAGSKSSPLRWVTAGSPTNYNMLLFRTLNRHMHRPNHNQDDLAPILLNELMPLRSWWLTRVPGALKMFRQGLEHKKYGVPGVVNFVDARTRWFDAVVKEALEVHRIDQVVVVAAGFDTRAYRIGAKYRGVAFFEVDLPHASKKKQQLVQELLQPEATFPRPTFLAADLSTHSLDAVLLSTIVTTRTAAAAAASGSSGGAAVFDPSKPTLFTVEGLLYYLPHEAVVGLLGSMLRVAAPGSRLAFDFLHKEVLEGSVPLPPAYKVTATSVANKGEPFISGIPNSRQGLTAFLNSIPSPTPCPAAPLPPPPPTPATTPTSPTTTAAAPPSEATEAGRDTGCVAHEADLAPAAAAAAGGDGCDGSAAGGSNGGSSGRCWRLQEYLGPREMVAQQLPHEEWDEALPPILSFYSFATAAVMEP